MSKDNYEYFKEEDSFQEYHADLNWPKPAHALSRSPGSLPGGEFYSGIEWMAAWMLDNVEGEQVDELTLRQWAVNAWLLHLEKHNA